VNLKLLISFGLVFAGIVLLIVEVGKARRTGEEGATVWFYNEQSHRLYEAPRDAIPPENGGVRAMVVAPRDEMQNRKIAYLETYAPPLRSLLGAVREAHNAGRPFLGAIPDRNSDFFQTNTLVRSLAETNWVPMSSGEGKKITQEWRSWRQPDGEGMIVRAP
jgi:hypothetical protein